MSSFIGLQRDADLPQIVRTGASAGTFASRLDGRQQQGDQNSNDSDHDQQFYQRETSSLCHR
jgi:hypothetical protein